jgi:hypothetical protein
MTVALVNFLSAFSLVQPSPELSELPGAKLAEINNDSTPQSFAEALAAIFLQVQPGLIPQKAPKKLDTPLANSLHPEFKARLDRVVERMKEEFGHTVQIVEGVRSQERQDFLYAQGRTQPGNIVTWTRSSKHTVGLAADVMIDGTYDNAVGYQRLAEIAQEEGLRTLGARDPGHIELAALTGNYSGQNTYSSSKEMVQSLEQPKVAKVSKVADVAEVAKVAEVADVAKVTMSISPVMHSAPTSSQLPSPLPTFSTVQASTTSESVAKTERVLEARDGGVNRPMSQIMLKVDNDTGGTDHIRVNVRGTTVDTTITLDDQKRVERLSQRVGELHSSLERRGLEAEVVRITTARESDRYTPHHRDTPRQQNSGSRNRPHRDKEQTER